MPLQIGRLLEVAAHLVAVRIEDGQVNGVAAAAEPGCLDVFAVFRLHTQSRNHGQCRRIFEGTEDAADAVALRARWDDVELAGHSFLDGFAFVHNLVADHARDTVTRQRTVLVVGVGGIGHLHNIAREGVAGVVQVELALAHDTVAAETEILDRFRQVAAVMDADLALQLGIKDGIAAGQAHHGPVPLPVR